MSEQKEDNGWKRNNGDQRAFIYWPFSSSLCRISIAKKRIYNCKTPLLLSWNKNLGYNIQIKPWRKIRNTIICSKTILGFLFWSLSKHVKALEAVKRALWRLLEFPIWEKVFSNINDEVMKTSASLTTMKWGLSQTRDKCSISISSGKSKSRIHSVVKIIPCTGEGDRWWRTGPRLPSHHCACPSNLRGLYAEFWWSSCWEDPQ